MPSFKIKHFIKVLFLCFILGSITVYAWNQTGDEGPFKLTIDSIMKGPDLVGTSPSDVMWSTDSKNLYFRWKKPDEEQTEFYFISIHRRNS